MGRRVSFGDAKEPSLHAPRAAAVLIAAVFGSVACAEGASIDPAGGSNTSVGSGGSGSGGSQASGSGGSSASNAPTSASSAPTTSSSGEGGSDQGGAGQGAAGGASQGSTGASASTGGHPDETCGEGEYVTSVDATGITCAPFATAAQTALASSCRVYLGWSDGCGACTATPVKWGYATTGQCANGAGLDNTCIATTLGATSVQLFGLNTDGDVDENDKFYGSLHCATGDTATTTGPCAPGSFASGVSGNGVTCSPASGLALAFTRQSCHLYMGWQDSCNACTTAPTKWGHVNDSGCVNGAGINGTCTVASLGGESVQLLGINTGGDVNNDDKFYYGFRCDEPAPATSETNVTCPAGQLVHGIKADGTLLCEAPSATVATTFRDHCTLYAGWRDSCNNCTTAPSKWGSVRANACTNGLGVENNCSTFTLGADSVQMFGLNTDGDVGDDDKFHVGFRCE